MITRRLLGQVTEISRWQSPNGTTYRRPIWTPGSSARMMSCTKYSLVSGVCGRPEKCTGTHTAPRRASIQVATGESIPDDSSVTTLPAEPTGRPPTPRSERAYT